MALVYNERREPVAAKCDDCGFQAPTKYGKQVAPWDEQIRVWDDDTDLCPRCYKKREEGERPLAPVRKERDGTGRLGVRMWGLESGQGHPLLEMREEGLAPRTYVRPDVRKERDGLGRIDGNRAEDTGFRRLGA